MVEALEGLAAVEAVGVEVVGAVEEEGVAVAVEAVDAVIHERLETTEAANLNATIQRMK